jgi:molybdopterin/thiamine biosynthesis adenylyltransferase
MTARSLSACLSSQGLLLGRRILIVGVGGLGCPAALSLADSGATLLLVDDDFVEASNLHRQILFDEGSLGEHKLDAARQALLRRGVPKARIELLRTRLLPDNARTLVASADLVLEGSDNFATKFLAADACFLEQRPIVHGAAVRLEGTVWSVSARGLPCYRCLFEDVPGGAQAGCAEAGVLGPVVGVCGALMADLALSALTADESRTECIFTFDGRRNVLREVSVAPRPSCSLCGAFRTISQIEETRYTAPGCAA